MIFQKMLLVLLMTSYMASVSAITPNADMNAAIKNVFSSLADVELMVGDASEVTTQEETTDKPKDINCGGFRAATCGDCPVDGKGDGKDKTFCNGDCKWINFECVAKPPGVSCGDERRANTCAECPVVVDGPSSCQGNCKWRENKCIHQDVLDPDILEHDCANVRKTKNIYDDKKKHPMLARISIRKGSRVRKWNHAYGIPVVAWDNQSDETVKRACYLLRYLFADNEWLRRYYYNMKFYFYGRVGGTCCPPFMGNQGLSCQCNSWVPYSLTPAHEAAHQFLRSVQKATKDGKMKMPEFTNTAVWSYKPNPSKPQWPKNDPWKEFLWNSWNKDKLNKKTKWGFGDHYYLESGQDQWLGLAKQGRLRDLARTTKERNNPELVKMMKMFWPCNNPYVMVCKDAAYNYKAGAAQKLLIGKADPNDPSKMICRDDLDKAELPSRGDRINPTDDNYQKRKGKTVEEKKQQQATYCKRALYNAHWILKNRKTSDLAVDAVNEALKEEIEVDGKTVPNYEGGKDTERNWYIQHCCAKTAKFSYATK